ncbi:MAG: helix-turn-helix domain-containing protein [Nitriliruptoraceae bacterium]
MGNDDRPPMPPTPAARRPMTADEAKALGHPTRLRIVFACRERAMTNKELAEVLATTPGTIHYHLRPLLAQGFLEPLAPRPGPRGSQEQPYRATGRSWELAGTDATVGALRAVAVDELLAASDDQVIALTRLGLTLTRRERDELVERLGAVLEAAVERSRDRKAVGPPAREGTREPGRRDAGGSAQEEAAGEPAPDGALEDLTVLLAVTSGRPASGVTG